MLTEGLTDRGKGGSTDDAQRHRWNAVAGHHHVVTDALVQGGQRRRAQDDVVARVNRRAREHRRSDRAARRFDEHRNRQVIDLDVREVRTRVRGDVVIRGQQPVSKAGGNGPEAVGRIEHGVEVPAVERGVRHQRLETRAEHERAGDNHDGEDRTDDRRAHGRRGAPAPRLGCEAEPGDRRHRQSGRGRGPARYDPSGGTRAARPARCGAWR